MSISSELLRGVRRTMYRTASGLISPLVPTDQTGNPLTTTTTFDLVAALKATADAVGATVTPIYSPSATLTVVKAGAGQLFSCVYINLTGQAITFMHVFLKTAAPTVGTTLPDVFGVTSSISQLLTVTVPPQGLKAPQGIRVALTNNVNSAVSAPAGGLIVVTWK
jgi:hypothetical protein